MQLIWTGKYNSSNINCARSCFLHLLSCTCVASEVEDDLLLSFNNPARYQMDTEDYKPANPNTFFFALFTLCRFDQDSVWALCSALLPHQKLKLDLLPRLISALCQAAVQELPMASSKAVTHWKSISFNRGLSYLHTSSIISNLGLSYLQISLNLGTGWNLILWQDWYHLLSGFYK